MRNFSIKGLDPEEFLEGVLLPFPHYSDEMSIDERPIANIYRYRFSNDFGLEFSFVDKLSSGHVRFLLYKKDSKIVEKFGKPSWGHRETLRHMAKICMSVREKDKKLSEAWKNILINE